MNNRLSLIYNLIDSDLGVLDVGTDHGYIPIALAAANYQGNIIASDINSLPLDIAKKNASASGVFDRISFVLADGIDPSCLNKVDTVIIAGMGGDTICHILDNAFQHIKNSHKFLLQPMSKPEILRYWLINNGFSIFGEIPVYDNDRLYSVIIAVYTGKNSVLTDTELYTGSIKLIEINELYNDIIEHYYNKFERICTGKSAENSISSSILMQLKNLIKSKDVV